MIRTIEDKRRFLQELAAGNARPEELLPQEHKLTYHEERDDGSLEELAIVNGAFVATGKVISKEEQEQEKKGRRPVSSGKEADSVHHMVIFKDFS